MSSNPLDILDISTLVLKHGAHSSPEDGLCAMEAVAFLSKEKHSDAPSCACPVISAVVRDWNDSISDDDTRTRLLRPLLPRLVGTRVGGDEVLLERMWMVIDWQIRTYVPAFLRVSGLIAAAKKKLAPVVAELQASMVGLIERLCAIDA